MFPIFLLIFSRFLQLPFFCIDNFLVPKRIPDKWGKIGPKTGEKMVVSEKMGNATPGPGVAAEKTE